MRKLLFSTLAAFLLIAPFTGYCQAASDKKWVPIKIDQDEGLTKKISLGNINLRIVGLPRYSDRGNFWTEYYVLEKDMGKNGNPGDYTYHVVPIASADGKSPDYFLSDTPAGSDCEDPSPLFLIHNGMLYAVTSKRSKPDTEAAILMAEGASDVELQIYKLERDEAALTMNHGAFVSILSKEFPEVKDCGAQFHTIVSKTLQTLP